MPGENNLFAASLWLMNEGSYGLRVNLQCSHGSGTTIVPLNVAPTRRPDMPTHLRIVLVTLIITIFVGRVWLVAVAAHLGLQWPTRITAALHGHTRSRRRQA